MRWLAYSLLSIEPGDVVAYVVPSRALIGQTRRNIAEMLIQYDIRPRIVTMPTLYQSDPKRKTILVMTQERIERLFSVEPNLYLRALVVDEAHKLGEGHRGLILQRIIDEAIVRMDSCRLVLAAPHAENAGSLLPRSKYGKDDSTTNNIVSDSRPTVLQNLFWVTPVPKRRSRWDITLVREQQIGNIGDFHLVRCGTGKKKRLAAIAFRLGWHTGGNIVYTNGAAEAENVALLLREYVEAKSEMITDQKELNDLAKLVKDTVHPSYPLSETLPYGVGVHYGDMPEIARREQERLFDEGKLSFLVCTSTLLEGVNLPCRNLFIWGPRQGRGNPMNEHTFWNLVGRAGRWGREFAGNIFCIDVHNEDQWPLGPPARRYKQKVNHSGTKVLESIDDFCQFANSEDTATASRGNRYFEQVLGELVSARINNRDLSTIGWIQQSSEEQISTLENLIESVMVRVTAPPDLIKRNPGINPILISQFFEHLKSLDTINAELMMPMTLDMPNPQTVLRDNLLVIDEHLGSTFGTEKQRNFIARITIDWIRGLPLGRIIKERIDFLLSRKKKSGKKIRVPAEIRSVIQIINENARYKIPKYLSCYSDCVSYWCKLIGREDLSNEIADMQDLLETGVSERTMIALISLGLSRTAAVELAHNIPDTQLSVSEVINWLTNRNLEAYSISPVIIKEVERALEATDFL